MEISNPHNLAQPLPTEAERRFGVRVRLPAADPVQRLLDPEWHQEHWFATATERDAALADLGKRHAYNRIGDRPTVILEAIER